MAEPDVSNGTVRIRLLDNDDKENVLLVLEREQNNKKMPNGKIISKPEAFGLPGGRITADDQMLSRELAMSPPLRTAHRELFEETGCVADIHPEPEIILTDDGRPTFLFHARNSRNAAEITDSDIIKILWYPWRLAYGIIESDNQKHRIYTSHVNLIQYYYDLPW